MIQEWHDMAYRFLLEVPESLVEDANVVINHVPDAQVLVIRNSHGTGFDDPSRDLTIAAHSLRVIQAIYKWKNDIDRNLPLARARIRIALHSGERLTVGDTTYEQMVAAIRRDQPWVERTIPKIGEHRTTNASERPLSTPLPRESLVEVREHDPLEAVATLTEPDVQLGDVTILATDDVHTHDTIIVGGVPHIRIGVHDLAKPERVYGEIFGTKMVSRGNHLENGQWEFMEPTYDVEQEAQFGLEPDYAFLRNGALAIAVERLGRGYPLDHYTKIPEPIHLLLDMESFHRVKAMVLMRSWDVRDPRPDAFSFRDPFGYTWAIVGHDGEGTSQ
jgi:hypothetical protein